MCMSNPWRRDLAGWKNPAPGGQGAPRTAVRTGAPAAIRGLGPEPIWPPRSSAEWAGCTVQHRHRDRARQRGEAHLDPAAGVRAAARLENHASVLERGAGIHRQALGSEPGFDGGDRVGDAAADGEGAARGAAARVDRRGTLDERERRRNGVPDPTDRGLRVALRDGRCGWVLTGSARDRRQRWRDRPRSDARAGRRQRGRRGAGQRRHGRDDREDREEGASGSVARLGHRGILAAAPRSRRNDETLAVPQHDEGLLAAGPAHQIRGRSTAVIATALARTPRAPRRRTVCGSAEAGGLGRQHRREEDEDEDQRDDDREHRPEGGEHDAGGDPFHAPVDAGPWGSVSPTEYRFSG